MKTIDANVLLDRPSDDWNWEAIEAEASKLFNTKIELDRKGDDPQEIAAAIWDVVSKSLEKREADLTTPFFLYFARHFWLEDIDNSWIEHLKAMENLRDGVGLRGYGQKDPKQEYKKEGFTLFNEMMDSTQKNVAEKLFKVQIVKEKQEQLPEFKHKQRKTVEVHQDASQARGEGEAGGAVDGAGEEQHADGNGDGQQAAPAKKQQTVRREEPKVGRNDPCPCGSGKKYKKCHGAEANP